MICAQNKCYQSMLDSFVFKILMHKCLLCVLKLLKNQEQRILAKSFRDQPPKTVIENNWFLSTQVCINQAKKFRQNNLKSRESTFQKNLQKTIEKQLIRLTQRIQFFFFCYLAKLKPFRNQFFWIRILCFYLSISSSCLDTYQFGINIK